MSINSYMRIIRYVGQCFKAYLNWLWTFSLNRPVDSIAKNKGGTSQSSEPELPSGRPKAPTTNSSGGNTSRRASVMASAHENRLKAASLGFN